MAFIGRTIKKGHPMKKIITETLPDAHRIDCAWCSKVLVPGPEPISHGICIYCRHEVLKELKRLKEKEPQFNPKGGDREAQSEAYMEAEAKHHKLSDFDGGQE